MLEQKTFDIWKTSRYKILLFGLGEYSKAIYSYLNEQGVEVYGFVVTTANSNYTETGEPIICIDKFACENHTLYRLILAIDCKYYNEVVPKLAFAAEHLYFLDEDYKQECLRRYKAKQISNVYDTAFYEENLQHQIADAHHVVKAITTFVQPKSVIDVGCGVGLITKTFRDFGAQEVFGVDGGYVDRQKLRLNPEHFISHDLTKPFILERRYDLTLSFEVAEHLDEQYAPQFINTLCSLSDIVAFSAAVPRQGGIQHVNEKPQSYWAQLFADSGYAPVDCIRPLIWNNPEVSDYYKQNIILYIKHGAKVHSAIEEYVQKPILDIIHPDLFGRIVDLWKKNRKF